MAQEVTRRGGIKSLNHAGTGTVLPLHAQKIQFKRGIDPRYRKEVNNLLAKDGTNRGGRRVRAGTKPDALAEKIQKGSPAKHMELPVYEESIDELEIDDAAEGVELEGYDMPNPSESMPGLDNSLQLSW